MSDHELHQAKTAAERILGEPQNERITDFEHYRLHEIWTKDEYVDSEQPRILESLHELEDMGFYGDNNLDHALARKRTSAIDYKNPATAELIRRVPSVDKWLELVPTASALTPLYHPEMKTLPNGHALHPELAEWFKNIGDGIGIRDRATLLKHIMKETTAGKTAEDIKNEQWLSLASGFGIPMLDSARSIQEIVGTAPNLTFADLDTRALGGVVDYAIEQKVSSNITVEHRNVLRRKGLDTPLQFHEVALSALMNRGRGVHVSREGLGHGKHHFAEAVGILEYLKDDDWAYRYNKVVKLKTIQAGARTFIKNGYHLVAPGGDFVVGNMLVDRPQLGFTLNTIQWPHIQPRSIDDMVRLFREAGIEEKLDVYVSSNPDNHEYALYRAHKPEDEQ